MLIGVEIPYNQTHSTPETIEELSFLVISAGGEVVDKIVQRRKKIDPAYFIGKGKTHQIKDLIAVLDIDTVVFDDELTPAQKRNLEKVFNIKVIDRTRLILDIFARRAHTQEGKLQVELAQLTYLLPRLSGLGTYLDQQVGGIGVRGPGEKKLEYDRRRITDRIAKLKEDIDKILIHRNQQRQRRKDVFLPLVAIVGYTNAGKSTLFNKITSSSVFVEDKLFATLDPTIRKVTLPNNQDILAVDIVGFIRKLPQQLIAAFRATLEETINADLLIHIVDISHPLWKKQMETVKEIFNELGILDKPVITVFNKIDLINDASRLNSLSKKFEESLNISAKYGTGIDLLLKRLSQHFQRFRSLVSFSFPLERQDLINFIYEKGEVVERKFDKDRVFIQAYVDLYTKEKLKKYDINLC